MISPAIRLQKTEIKKNVGRGGRHLLKQELAANMRTFCKRLTRSQAHACPVDVHYIIVKKMLILLACPKCWWQSRLLENPDKAHTAPTLEDKQ